MMRIGELVQGMHTIKARNMHMGHNKDKMLLVLYHSKTHSEANYPQKIKIAATTQGKDIRVTKTSYFCPFELMRQYIARRGDYINKDENLFIFADKTTVKPEHVRKSLRKCIKNVGLNPNLYDCHSLRAGRTCDLWRAGIPVEQIKAMGRWKSNAIYKYLKD